MICAYFLWYFNNTDRCEARKPRINTCCIKSSLLFYGINKLVSPKMASSLYNISTYSRFNLSESESDIPVFVDEYRKRIKRQLAREEEPPKSSFISFVQKGLSITDLTWLQDNRDRFFKGTENKTLVKLDYLSECGYIFCMEFSPEGDFVIIGHSSGLIQMRHGSTGTVLCTLRNVQFPPKPVYAIEYSMVEERVCYAACMDGAIYRIEIPNVVAPIEEPPLFCIRADPALESFNMQFYGSPGISSYSTPFITQRSPALSLGLTADQTKMAVGYGDSSIKVYDMETQETEQTYKVHKLRLQFIPKKLQRMHFGQVCALRCHKDRPYMFASAAWDKTLRRDHCIAGSWQATEALTVWDLVARKRMNVIRVQNRRQDVDGEYIYACRYWNSSEYNRKGKYAIVGGSGTNCLEVINLHNRYISCSYPASGTVLAVASHGERVAFGGTAPVFNIASFHDPKHEKQTYHEEEIDIEYKESIILRDEDFM
ncbi:uncharacterized protein LOC114243221 isoform X2 [Bombyx mandarina]|uniref:Uncharacterized protein LOC114243221 isoform X2 n=1 Tax=Bombyx mandarina TaxID=7092 RepID=A0A6J2JN28_BOMMA|nr:uncharacterized protein LOC114243221 isoform X2 [Bombyx mandarina]